MARSEHGRDDRHGADVDQLLDTLVFVVEERVRNRIACNVLKILEAQPEDRSDLVTDLAGAIRRGECG